MGKGDMIIREISKQVVKDILSTKKLQISIENNIII